MNFLQDDKGNASSMRLMCIMSLLAAIGFGYLTMSVIGTDHQTGVQITTLFLIAAFAPKALQKYIENSNYGQR